MNVFTSLIFQSMVLKKKSRLKRQDKYEGKKIMTLIICLILYC